MSPGSPHPELEGTFCVVADCLDPVHALASAHIVLPASIGMPDGYEYLTFDIPVCSGHQYLLRQGVRDVVMRTPPVSI